jgi:two-component system, NarL family, sensor histidine kinase UhpB
MMAGVGRRLIQRVFLLNAAILLTATIVLVVSAATISVEVEIAEAIVVLAVGFGAILGVNYLVLRAVFAPLERLGRLMRRIDLRHPGERLDAAGTEDVRELVDVFNDMLDRLERERQGSARLALAAQEGERRRIAQELHDEIGQELTGILLRLETLAREAPEWLVDDVRRAQDSARAAIDRISSVVRQLRPEALDDLGLRNALLALVHRVEDEAQLAVDVTLGDVEGLGPERELVVYRVAQESLTNVVRHAGASSVTVTLTRNGTRALLRVADDGAGFAPGSEERHGIAGMRERAMLVGGELTVANGAAGGAVVELEVPLS